MNTHVIILAQGSQKRLGDLPVAKQMLPLPACGGTPILYRTLRQLWHVMGGVHIHADRSDRVTVVTWPLLVDKLRLTTVDIPMTLTGVGGKPVEPRSIEWRFTPSTDTLDDPGNSSLKGISRFLEVEAARRARRWALTPQVVPPDHPEWDRTVVLLGDVVYSWACLRAIFAPFREDPRGFMTEFGATIGDFRFVGTSDISPSGGELWGIAWPGRADIIMKMGLKRALDAHPPFAEYQPGQLRRWMWAMSRTFQTSTLYSAVDDYTRDIDTPEHVLMLPELSKAAAADDEANGVTW